MEMIATRMSFIKKLESRSMGRKKEVSENNKTNREKPIGFDFRRRERLRRNL